MGRFLLSIFFVSLICTPALVSGQERRILINEIAVQGNRRIQEAVVLGRVQSKAGSQFLPARLADDIKAIFALGFFDDVQMKVEEFEGGVKVTFVVLERPFIRDIEFVGAKQLDAKDLQEKIDLKLGSVYNPVEVQKARDKLKDHYEEEGYFEAQITPQTEKVPDGDVRVVFRIVEGRKIRIDRIVIEGAKGLTPKQIKAIMVTQERQYFILRGKVQRQQLENDIERILFLYNNHGYIQARVESHDISLEEKKARVTIRIVVVEGPQFTVGSVDLTGPNVLPIEEVRRQILLKPGDVFSRSKVRESIDSIAAIYSNIGRASADINVSTNQDSAERKIHLTFEVKEGPEVFVERINITGNVRSDEKILRRELPMAEGDLFTSQKLEKAKQRLVNLGYFDDVKATTTPGSQKDRIVISIAVTEKPTGLFSIGAGYSSVDSFIGTLDLSQRNFLGKGLEVSFRARVGENTQQGVIGITEPWLFDRPLSAGFDVFLTRRVFTEFTIDSLGGGARLSHPFLEFSRWHLNYRLSRDEVSDVASNASTVLREQEGITVTSAMGGALTRDSRDNVFTPTRGSRSSVSVDVAGLGGDNRFVKTLGEVTYFHPVFWGTVLAGRAEAGYGFGYGGRDFPLFERFFLGGPNSVRSRKARAISPKDESGTLIGGDSELLFNLEYLVPVGFGIRLATFFDAGNAYGFGTDFDPLELRKAAGVGARWQSPFGPIRFDWGFNLDRKTGEKLNEFHFSVGSPF
jgi:outer membrane protein insertion porin family